MWDPMFDDTTVADKSPVPRIFVADQLLLRWLTTSPGAQFVQDTKAPVRFENGNNARTILRQRGSDVPNSHWLMRGLKLAL